MLYYTASARIANDQLQDTVSSSLDEATLQSLMYLKAALNNNPAYELYKTENMWTFLKLETSTGKIWQVQVVPYSEHIQFHASRHPYRAGLSGSVVP